jgi:hypothetical protein
MTDDNTSTALDCFIAMENAIDILRSDLDLFPELNQNDVHHAQARALKNVRNIISRIYATKI